MEVLQTERHFIFVKREKTLWWDRSTFEFTAKHGWDLSAVDDVECLGIVHGIIGLIHLRDVHEPQLLLIREIASVGVLYIPHEVHKIRTIAVLGAESGLDADIQSCSKHRSENASPKGPSRARKVFNTSPIVNKTWGAMKSGAKSAASIASNQIRGGSGKGAKTAENTARIGRKLTEELHRIFDDSDSFYFCSSGDITNNLQHQGSAPDDRFYWNQHMLQSIIALEDPSWVLPVIQGFIQIEVCCVDNECLSLALVSRRSRHRAGTRYKRRGIDGLGFVANYVETEQILTFKHHQLAFSQVRGSVPVYWSQRGYKYRPPPQLDKGEEETFAAFKTHFDREIERYNSICVVNLVEQSGKEKIIADAYSRNIVKYNSDKIIYVTFDFHTYCRGMHFENVAILVDSVAQVAGAMGFCWRDAKGSICDQKGVFRVNCMDCLDRTNVVMTAIGKAILTMQLIKLGLLTSGPASQLPDELKSPFMLLWANNGDVISRQYAGTDALKGDFTRTGERKVSGMLKDGMNSANRYYLARFKDAYRQATIDLMVGNEDVAETLSALGKPEGTDEMDALEGAEHAKILVEDCRRLLCGETTLPVGAWGLINADPSSGDMEETEVDIILLLTESEYIVAEYDAELDKIVRFEEVPLTDVIQVEVGMYQPTKLFSGSRFKFHCFRLNYSVNEVAGYFHMFRSPNIRFFNNVAVVIKTEEEKRESLSSIVECFRITLESAGNKDVTFVTGEVLERKKSRSVLLDVPSSSIPRNLSESQLVQASSKALTSVAGHFSKLSKGFKRGKGDVVDAEKCQTSPRGSDDGHISDAEELMENVLIKDNEFLPSVGIVMTNCEPDVDVDEPMLLEKESVGEKAASDMSTLSISSVANTISMPSEMLENEKTPIRPRSPIPKAPAAIRQIKNLTVGQISKFAKGVQNISSNLDPRKINVARKLPGESPSMEDYREKLYQMWIDNECQTKLIAI